MSIKQRGKEQKGSKKKSNSCKIYVFAEGDTEEIYLKHFSNRKYGIDVIMVDSGHTDAIGIVEYAKGYMADSKNIFDYSLGDRCYCVFDSDPQSNPSISKAFSLIRDCQHKGLYCIFSNPCFEVWFVLHFRTAPVGKSASDMKRIVRKLVESKYPSYCETTDIFEYLDDKRETAKQRALRLHEQQEQVYDDVLSHECNPYTNIFEFFDYLETVKKVER